MRELNSKQTIIGFWFIFLLISAVHGSYIKDFPVKVAQPDGRMLELFVSGDEYSNSLHDKNGYTVVQDPQKGYYVYAVMENECMAASSYPANGPVDPKELKIPVRLSASDSKTPGERPVLAAPAGVGKPPRQGKFANIVIFVRFRGESEFKESLESYNAIFNDSRSGANSLRNYFYEASYGQLTLSTTFYPVTAGRIVSYQDSQAREYYQPYHPASNPIGYLADRESGDRVKREQTLLKNAIESVSSQIPRGLEVDANHDGLVDNICFIVSGGPSAGSALLWPHMWDLYSENILINGKRVCFYNLQLHDFFTYGAVGVLAHEMGHSLGFPDLYRYYSAGVPVGLWDPMAVNSDPPPHMSAYMKCRYGGWIDSIPEITASGRYTLNALTASSNNCYKISSPNSDDEYFILEYRKKSGVFETILPSEGLIIYRVNQYMGGNGGGPPDEMYIYRPEGTSTSDGQIERACYSLNTGRTAISDFTDPSCFLSGDRPGGINISDIGETESGISFFIKLNRGLTVGSIPNLAVDIGVSPDDMYGNGTAPAHFLRTYPENTNVTLTAPPIWGKYLFSHWTLGETASFDPRLEVKMDANRKASVNYYMPIGEAVDNAGLTFSNGGNAAWFGQENIYKTDKDAARSGAISNNQVSHLSTDLQGPGVLKFYWKVSSETNYDFLTVSLDGVRQDRISGDADWQEETLAIGAGRHRVTWSYEKDLIASRGSDCGWVDHVSFVSNAQITVTAPNGGERFKRGNVCEVTWKWKNITGDITLTLVKGATRILDIGTFPVNSGGTQWTVPANVGVGSDYRICIAQDSLEDYSDEYFTILSPPNPPDFNNDGKVDTLWRNLSNGAYRVWYQDGVNILGYGDLPEPSDKNLRIVGTGDFNHDGNIDILWQHASNGNSEIWYLNGVAAIGKTGLPRRTDAWEIAGTGDFNNDGKADILWQNTKNGAVQAWQINGPQIKTVTIYNKTDTAWQIIGTGDFNNDGHTDILWRNRQSGENEIWYIKGFGVIGTDFLPRLTDPQWHVKGTGDFNLDGKTDILWRNSSTGIARIWYLDEATVLGYGELPTQTEEE
ncbi:MAG: M6 family metalloprotease domain-containing protein [Candidatus Omnitrophota bacterium]